MQELLQNGFRGVFRMSEAAEMEKSLPNFLAYGRDIVLDLVGNAYVTTGTQRVATESKPIVSVYYSESLRRLLITDTDGTLFTYQTDGTKDKTYNAIFATNPAIVVADWPVTSTAYVSNGKKYYAVTNTAATDKTASLPVADSGECVIVHQSTMFVTKGNLIYPSTQGDPEEFDETDSFKAPRGGDTINALSVRDDCLEVHKQGTIYEVVGDIFIGDNKNFQVINRTTGRGAIGPKAVWCEGSITYFVGYDGLYRYSGSGNPERISRALDGYLGQYWESVPKYASVVYFSPTWGIDAGSRYILFKWAFNYWFGSWGDWCQKEFLWKFNLDTGDWTEIGYWPWDITFSRDDNIAFLTSGAKVLKFSNVSTYDGAPITGEMITNQIDAGTRVRDKDWFQLYLYPCEASYLSVYAGYDGAYPTIDLDIDQSAVSFELASHLLNFRFKKTGGGRPIVGGYALQYTEIPSSESRSWASSKNYTSEWLQRNYPLLGGGQEALTIDPGVFKTITHTVNIAASQQCVFACIQGTVAKLLRIEILSEHQFNVYFPAGYTWAGTHIIHWLVMPRHARCLYDSFMAAREVSSAPPTTSCWYSHNLNQTPEAFLYSVGMDYHTASCTSGVKVDNIEARRCKINWTAEAHGYFITTGCYKAGSDDWFHCGTASSSPISHGYSSAPKSVILVPNQLVLPNFGLTAISTTQITYSGTGDFYWFALHPDTGEGE